MVYQSSTPQLDAAAPSSSQAVAPAAPATTAATSNQAALDDAGLTCDADAQDTGLLGDMAEVVLGALPMSAALHMAAAHLEEAAVRAWVLAQDPVEMVYAMTLDLKDRLLDQWPVGLGVFAGGEAGAALGVSADLKGDIELIRPAADQVVAKVKTQAVFGMAEVGAKLKLEGAGERAMAALGATGEAAVEIGMQGQATTTADTAMMVALGAAASPGLVLAILGGAKAINVASGAMGLDLPTLFPASSFLVQNRAALVAEAKATAGQELLDAMPVDLGTLVTELQPYLDGLQGFFDGRYKGEAELLASPGAAQVTLRHSLSALAELAGMPLLASLTDWSALDALSHELGGRGSLEVVVGLHLGDQGLVPDFDGRMSVLLEGQREDAKSTDRLDFDVDELPGLIAGLASGQGLAAVVGAMGFQRTVELPAPQAMIAAAVPEVAMATTRMMGDQAVVAGSDDLHLVGQVTAGADAMQIVADAGIQVPEGSSVLDAVHDLHAALCALACGQPVAAPWLAAWLPALEQAASRVVVAPPRLVGRVQVALGFEAGATGVATVGADAKLGTGFAVDRVVNPDAAGAVMQALGVGAFVVPTVTAPGVDELDECPTDDAAQSEHADTGTETTSTAVAASPDAQQECAA
ncbi:hypothetical protein L6R53_26330 [Myxococcota bacterium]|nr:hypothetical protein [Myxococcota bacterium]